MLTAFRSRPNNFGVSCAEVDHGNFAVRKSRANFQHVAQRLYVFSEGADIEICASLGFGDVCLAVPIAIGRRRHKCMCFGL